MPDKYLTDNNSSELNKEILEAAKESTKNPQGFIYKSENIHDLIGSFQKSIDGRLEEMQKLVETDKIDVKSLSERLKKIHDDINKFCDAVADFHKNVSFKTQSLKLSMQDTEEKIKKSFNNSIKKINASMSGFFKKIGKKLIALKDAIKNFFKRRKKDKTVSGEGVLKDEKNEVQLIETVDKTIASVEDGLAQTTSAEIDPNIKSNDNISVSTSVEKNKAIKK